MFSHIWYGTNLEKNKKNILTSLFNKINAENYKKKLLTNVPDNWCYIDFHNTIHWALNLLMRKMIPNCLCAEWHNGVVLTLLLCGISGPFCVEFVYTPHD